jgi:hypothetical protein
MIADVVDDAQVMSDEQISQAKAFLEFQEQIEDLRLYRNVQRRDGLVGHDESRIESQSTRDADALPLPAAEPVRKAAHVLRPQAHKSQELCDPVDAFLVIAGAVNQQWLRYDVEHRHTRIERRKRILKDHLHLATERPQTPSWYPSEVHDIARRSPEEDLTGGGFNGTQHAAGGRGFATTALPDERQGLAVADMEAHVVDRSDLADFTSQETLANGKQLLQMPDVKERVGTNLDRAVLAN